MMKDFVRGTLVACVAVTVCMLVPIAGLIGAVFIPVPLIYYRVKIGQPARFIALGAAVYVSILGGRIEFFFFGTLLLTGLVVGELVARNWPIERMAATVCGAVLVIATANLWVYSLAVGQDMWGALDDGVQRQLELTLRLYQEMGLPQEQVFFLESRLDVIRQVMIGMLPSLVLSSTLITIWVSLLTSRWVLQRQGLPFPDYGPLDHWKAPEMFVWGVIVSGGLLLLPDLTIKTVGLNGLVIFTIVYFFQGIAVVAYFLRKKQVPRAARAVLYGLIAFQQIMVLAVAGVGFFDTWFNFRKIGKPLASA
jgi:uncharacterized protein YybS (DUF2232 family)